ncbi:MAG TPA: DUF488 domain-containing protein [Ktedonobacterales bacterium]|nr:DUF488 domain-containing protein [Ktedonobacterales bacterium]
MSDDIDAVDPSGSLSIYSIGHSNQTLEKFLGLLEQRGIQILADVRSSPYSRYVPHFNRLELEDAVERRGIQYLFMGDTLGGRPEGDEFYDDEGYVLYFRVAEAPFFQRGLERIKDEAAMSRVAIMCSEEDPTNCHRRLLIGRVLAREAIPLLHIRGDGDIHREEDLLDESPAGVQLSLWDALDPDETRKEQEWSSIQPVSRRRPPKSSSEHSNDTESDDFWTSD